MLDVYWFGFQSDVWMTAGNENSVCVRVYVQCDTVTRVCDVGRAVTPFTATIGHVPNLILFDDAIPPLTGLDGTPGSRRLWRWWPVWNTRC
jgi:hypothetical protein